MAAIIADRPAGATLLAMRITGESPLRSPRPLISLAATIAALAAGLIGLSARQSAAPPADLSASVDRIARDVLVPTGVPSASVAVVRGGRLVYAQAYGSARLSPAVAATPAMRYSIGSISKQFTASAILLLQQEGKLSLDDPVGKFVPGLTRGSDVTIRQVLSHTSGYQDYWPQDYVPPFMLTRIDAQGILDRWARRPLDFEPGTEWQYLEHQLRDRGPGG